MKRKYLFTILFVAMLSLSLLASGVIGVFAEDDPVAMPTTLLAADKLFSSTWSNTAFAYNTEGLTATLETNSLTSSDAEITYATTDGNVRLDMEKFSITFGFDIKDSALFEDLKLVFFDYGNSSKYASITLSRDVREVAGAEEVYLKAKIVNSEVNSANPLEQEITGFLKADKYSLNFMTLSYSEGKFYLRGDAVGSNDVELKLPADPKNGNAEEIYFTENGKSAEGINYNEARLSIAVIGLRSSDTEKSASVVLTIKSIENIMGVQKLLADEAVVAPILRTSLAQSASDKSFSAELSEDMDKTVYAYVNNFGETLSYTFPFYIISFNNIPLQYADAENIYLERSAEEFTSESSSLTNDEWTNDENWTAIESISSSSSFSVGSVGTWYRFHFYLDREDVEHIVFLTIVKDENAPRINNRALGDYITSQNVKQLIGSEEGITLPNLKVSSVINESLFFFAANEFNQEYLNLYGVYDEEIGEYVLDPDDKFNSFDTVNNITVYLGYKKPDSTSDWTYTTNFTLTNSTLTGGRWTFCYRVRDTASNEEVSTFTFYVDVLDTSPPVLTVSSERVEAYIDQIFTVTLATVSERGGSTADPVVVTMYKGLRGNTDDPSKIVYLSKSNQYLFTEADRSASTTTYSYYLKFECKDSMGNVSTPKYVNIFVVDEPDTTVDPLDEVNTLFYILLGFAAILIMFIVIMLVVPEKPVEASAAPYSAASNDKSKAAKDGKKSIEAGNKEKPKSAASTKPKKK